MSEAKWRYRKYEIRNRNGLAVTIGWAFGLFAYNKWSGNFHVTHLPTGLKCAVTELESEAVWFCEKANEIPGAADVKFDQGLSTTIAANKEFIDVMKGIRESMHAAGEEERRLLES